MITIEINSIDKTDVVLFNSLSIKDKINNNLNEAKFVIKKNTEKTYAPKLNDEVVIYNDTTKIFGGQIVRMTEGVNAGNDITLNIQCTDYTQLLQRQLVIQRYQDTTVHAIIENLIDDYTTDGFTINNVTFSKTISSFSFNGLTVFQCLNKLAQSLNAFWYVDYDKDIHFFQKLGEPSPFNLTDTSGNYIFNSLTIEDDITQLKNKVTVRGGTNPSDTNRTETTVCQDDTQDVYPLGYKFALLPIVKVNNVAVTVGAEFLTDDSTVDCQWSFQEKYIRFTAGNIPNLGDIITVEGKILIPVVVRTTNQTSIGEFGVFEYQIEDTTIATNDEAIDRALVELQSYSQELNEGSFRTYNHGLHSGQVLTINSTIRDKNIKVLIQDVTIKPRTPIGDSIEYTVNFATTKTFGIIDYLQQSLINERIDENELETLLNFLEFSESLSIQDELLDITKTSPPYVYGASAGNVGVWNFSSWS